MVNEPEPRMLTVGELRAALNLADPNQVVIFRLSADDLAHIRTAPDGIGIVLAVKVDRASPNGPVFRLASTGADNARFIRACKERRFAALRNENVNITESSDLDTKRSAAG